MIYINLNYFKLGFNTVGDIFTPAYSYPKQATYQKSQTIELACKSYAQDTLLLNFKITKKIFWFTLHFSNKSCRAKLLEYNKIGLAIFGFFYKFLWIFQVG
jgi:hypothetical protein